MSPLWTSREGSKSRGKAAEQNPAMAITEEAIDISVNFIMKYLDTVEPGKDETNYYEVAIDGIKARLPDQKLSDEDAKSLLRRGVRRYAERKDFTRENINYASGKDLFFIINHDVNEEIIRAGKETRPPREESIMAARVGEIRAELERIGAIDKIHKQMRNNDELHNAQPDGLLRHSTAEAILDTAIRKFADDSFEPFAFMHGKKTKWDMISSSNDLQEEMNKYVNEEIQDAIRRGKKRMVITGKS